MLCDKLLITITAVVSLDCCKSKRSDYFTKTTMLESSQYCYADNTCVDSQSLYFFACAVDCLTLINCSYVVFGEDKGCSLCGRNLDYDSTQVLKQQSLTNSQDFYLRKEHNLAGCSRSCTQLPVSDMWLGDGHVSNKIYSEILTKLTQKKKKSGPSDIYVFATKTWGYRMSIINGQLWAPIREDHTIQIFDPQIKIKQISLSYNGDNLGATSVKQISTSEVILVTQSGLYILHALTESVLYQVAGGFITDVAIDCNCIRAIDCKAYAYNQTNNNVVTVSYIVGKWLVTNTFTAVSTSAASHFHTITVQNNLIYICAHTSHKIDLYTMTGSYLTTYGVLGTSLPGELNKPYLCGTDSMGAVLVCDTSRLQVLSADGNWRVYVVQSLTEPRDVLVDTSGNMWILWKTGGDFKISKFSA